MAQIIHKNFSSVESNWQKELAESFTAPEKLLTYLQIDPLQHGKNIAARKLFPMRVPKHFVDLMEKGNIHDPLLQQVMPMAEEFENTPGFVADPLQEHNNAQTALLHKYQSRVLLIVKGGCAINCRYCFRRHFPYQENSANKAKWLEAINYIRQNPQVNEVIYSGGDPLMAKDSFLAWLTEQIANVPHIKRLRIHTRLPVVIPNRINSDMLAWLEQTSLQKVLVLHINHPNEIDRTLGKKLAQLKAAGVTLLNQGVLLKGVNDNPDVLCELSEKLFEVGVLPYYLFTLDKVKGAGHFDISDEKAKQLMAQMIKRLPGYLVPKLTKEIGGQPGKTPVDLNLHP